MHVRTPWYPREVAELPLDDRVAIHSGEFTPSTHREAQAVLAWQRHTNNRFWLLWIVLVGGAGVANVVAILDRGGLVPGLIAVALLASLIVIWLVVIRVQRRQVEHMARQARAVLATKDDDSVG